MTLHFADRLQQAIEIKGSPVCVGLDPRFERLPRCFQENCNPGVEGKLEAVSAFCYQLLDVIAETIAVVKPQIACFEIFKGPGMSLYFDLVRRAKELGLIVIGDIKRGDIGTSAQAYAQGHMTGPDSPDAVTVNGYFGTDGLKPFIDIAREQGKGLFALVRTSNPSAVEVQDFVDSTGKKFYQTMAENVARLGGAEELIGLSGLSCVGAVVGATYPEEAAELRKVMDQQVFLVPGYGAQGGTAADCKASFRPDGTGAIVNASRSVIYAHANAPDIDWKLAVAQAATAFAEDLRSIF